MSEETGSQEANPNQPVAPNTTTETDFHAVANADVERLVLPADVERLVLPADMEFKGVVPELTKLAGRRPQRNPQTPEQEEHR